MLPCRNVGLVSLALLFFKGDQKSRFLCAISHFQMLALMCIFFKTCCKPSNRVQAG